MVAPLVIGTAGHVDHGKTSLVLALTGIDTDRLPVEKQRGITTELGFAHLELDGRRAAVIDVPGHERFVRAMVAGAGGVDLVCLVIAADEGVMPQTREHLDICQLLGVQAGVVALTKRDLVDDEWLAMVTGELRTQLAGSFLDGAPIVPVSARTGAGLDALRDALAARARALAPRDPAAVLRVPIDRVFTIKGFGTVATGTIWGGRVQPGDELVILPRGTATRARGVEVHGGAADAAIAGQRVAVNLAGVAVDEVARGDMLAHPDRVVPSHILDVQYRHLPSAEAPLRSRARVLLHHGTAQVMATLVLAGGGEVAPGATVAAQLRLDARTPVCALPGDRFIVRGFVAQRHHGTTLGGGLVTRVQAAKLRGATPATLASAELADATLDARVVFEARASQAAGTTAATLGPRVGQPADSLGPRLAALVAAGELVAVGDGYLHAAIAAELEQRIVATLDAAPGRAMAREAVRAKLPTALAIRAFDVLVAALAQRGAVTADGDTVKRDKPGAAAPALSPADRALVEKFVAWGLEPPRPAEIADKPTLDRLLAARAITRIKPDYFVATPAVAALRDRLIAFLDAHAEITPQQWKELTATTRKFAIPLAEHFDAEKVTLRVGEIRRRRR